MVKTLFCRLAASASSNVRPLLLHQHADPLDRQERRVAFVHVEDGGLEVQRLQRAQAADAEHDLLADARVDVAAVQRIGDVAVLVAQCSPGCWCRAGTASCGRP